MATRPIIGVMGPGEGAMAHHTALAEELGLRIAEAGWVTLSGGRNSGVMEAVNRGAKQGNGLTIAILPTRDRKQISEFVDIPVITEMGSARNVINVLSSDVVVACGMARGTASEVALALKSDKPVILLASSEASRDFFREIGGNLISVADSPKEAINICRHLLKDRY